MMSEIGKDIRMNKKGEESTPTGSIIKVVIAVFVLVIVVIALYLFFTGKGMAFFKFLPGFNETKPKLEGPEIFSYNFLDDKIRYYDGNAWNDFEGKTIEINDKKFSYTGVYGNFSGFGYFSTKDKVIVLGSTAALTIRAVLIGRSNKGQFNGIYKTMTGEYWCALSVDDSSFVCGKSAAGASLPIDKQNLVKVEMIKWKKEILSKPMKISYYNIYLKKDESVYACTRILASQGKYYLVADLDNSVAEADKDKAVCKVN